MTTYESELLPIVHATPAWVELRKPALELAEAIADSSFVPKGLRGNPPAILACIMFGDELGLGPMQSLARIAVIDGMPTLRAETMRALVLAAGHELWIDEATSTRVTVSGKRAGSTRTSSVTWTMDDARTAGLAGKPVYRAYPRAMLTARATAELVRTVFADVVGGLPALEERDDELELGEPEAKPRRKTSPRRRADKTPPEGPQEAAGAPESDDGPIPGQVTVDEALAPAAGSYELLESAETAETAEPTETAETTETPTLDDALAEPALKSKLVDPYAQELLETVEALETQADPPTPVDQLAAQAERDAAVAEPLTDKQMRKMQALFRELDVTSRGPRLEYCATVVGRKLASSKELTQDDAGRVIDALEAWKANPPGGPFGDGIPYL